MPDSNRYTTLSIRKGLKDDLERLKDSSETYGDVLQRAIASEREVREEVDHRLSHLATVQQQQSRLLVRMAVSNEPLDKEQIPQNLAEYEAWGGDNPWAAFDADEETVDVYGAEKRAKMQAREEVLDLDEVRNNDGPLHGGRISPEQEERIEERTAEILEEENAGGTLPWEADNNEGDSE